MSYVKRNVGGKWETIFVSPGDDSRIRKETFEQNVRILKRIKEDPLSRDFSEQEKLAIFETIKRHYYYNVEEFVDSKLVPQEINKNFL